MTALPLLRERRCDPTGGFLLTETLATFTISAFVLLGLVSASSVLLRAVDRSVAHVQDVDDLGTALNAIERDVSGLTRARWNGYEPQPFVFQGGPNSLYFAHAQREADGSSQTIAIALREIAISGNARLMRSEARLSARATGFDSLTYGPQRPLGTGPARLRFFYIAKAGLTRVSTWQSGPTLPLAIIVEAVERGTGRLIMSKHVPIRANADIGCLARDKTDGTGAPTSSAAAAFNAPTASGGARQTSTSDAASSPPPAAAGVPEPEEANFCGRPEDTRKSGPQGSGRQPQRQTPSNGPTL